MMLKEKMIVIFGLSVAMVFAGESSSVANKKSLTRDGAKIAIEAIIAEAEKVGAPGAGIAVVDEGGNLICVERLDGTFAAAWRISIGKARTAAAFGKPTNFFEKVIREGRTPMLALDDFTPLQGGVPIVVDGTLVGAIGVSGASSAQQDEELANVGVAAVLAPLSRSSREARVGATQLDKPTETTPKIDPTRLATASASSGSDRVQNETAEIGDLQPRPVANPAARSETAPHVFPKVQLKDVSAENVPTNRVLDSCCLTPSQMGGEQ